MERSFLYVIIELGIPTFGMLLSLVGIAMYSYIYFKLYEERQLIILFLGILSFIFSSLEFANIIISLSKPNNTTALYLYRIEQIVLSLTIIPWMMYIKGNLELSERYHFVFNKLYVLGLFLIALISAVGMLYPQLFISQVEPISTLNQTMANSIKSRGEIGYVYIFRDFVFSLYMIIIVSAFVYEIAVNKIYKRNVQALVLTSVIAISFFDDFNGISIFGAYSSDFLIFPNVPFSRIILAYALYNIVRIHSSVNQFISNIFYKRASRNYNLEDIRAQDTVIINAAINASRKIAEFKSNLQKTVNELLKRSNDAHFSIRDLKSEINKNIDSINQFLTVENFQVNDAYSNIDKINELIDTYPKLQAASEAQNSTLENLNAALHESIKQIYDLQAESLNVLKKFNSFQKLMEKEKSGINSELNKTSILSQLNFQINKIVSFMTNMSEKAKTLSINSSIQASKSGEWHGNFASISKGVSDFVNKTSHVSERMQSLLYQIEEIFKRFNYSSRIVNGNIGELIKETALYHERMIKFNKGMERQNNYNMNVAKSADKMYDSISNIGSIITNQKNDFINIKLRIQEFNDYVVNISERAFEQNSEIKNFMRDVNRLLATSEDLESVSRELSYEKDKLLEYSNNLESIINEYSKVV